MNQNFKRMKNILTIAFLCGFVPITFSQSVHKVLSGMKAVMMSDKGVQMNLTYSLYKGKETNKPIEQYQGKLIQFKKSTYLKIHETETVYNNSFFVKVNHNEKEMIYRNTQSKQVLNNPMDLAQILNYFESGELQDKGTYWEFNLIPKSSNLFPISKMTFQVHKKTHLPIKQIYFYAPLVNLSQDTQKESKNQSRLEIVFSDHKKGVGSNKERLKKEYYIKLNGNQTVVANRLSNYQLRVVQ